MGRVPHADTDGHPVYVYRRAGEAVLRVREHGAHRGAGGPQPVLVPALPAAFPVPGAVRTQCGSPRDAVRQGREPWARVPPTTRVGPMVAASHPGRPTGLSAGRVLTRRWNRAVRRLRESDLVAALLLVAAAVLIGVAQYDVPVIPLTTLVIPMVIGNLVLAPRVAALGGGVLALRPGGRRGGHPEPARRPADRRRGGDLPDRDGHPGVLVPAHPARRRRGPRGVDAGGPARPDPQPGRDARAAQGLVRRGGAPLGRRLVVRRRLPGRLALLGRHLAPGRRRRRLRQGRAGRVPVAAALRRLRRAARRPAGRELPAGRQRLPAPPGLARGLRDGRARQHRPADRCVRAALGRSPARRTAARGVGPLGGARGGGPGARADAAAPSSAWCTAGSAAATRCCCSPTGWSRPPSGTSRSGSTSCSGRASGCSGAAWSRAPTG